MRHEPETLRGLIERVKQATGGDHRLDEDIEAALGWPLSWCTDKARPFTSSLDAAASLVPVVKWTLGTHQEPDTNKWFWKAWVGRLRSHQGVAATPALALTAAALRARLAEMEGDATDDATKNR